MIKLYDDALSPCCQKVRLALAEKGLPIQLAHVNLSRKENLNPDYLRLNPKGVLPTLVEDDLVVTESSIIMEYVDDAHPAPPLRPTAAAERVRMRAWMRLVDDEVHLAIGAVTWPILAVPKLMDQAGGRREAAEALVARSPSALRRQRQLNFLTLGLDAPETHDGIAVFSKALDAMQASLADSEWLAGPTYSLADAALTPYAQTFAQFGLWELVCGERSVVAAWFERIRARPSFGAAIQASVPDATWAHVRKLGSDAAEKIGRLLAA
jgi:glutathione S-transferase